MASTTVYVYTLFTATGMAPGVTWNFGWNNLPQGTAYVVDAMPYNLDAYFQGYPSTIQVEISRVWRRTRQTGTGTHNDILGQIKNVGNDTLDYSLYLVVFT